MRVATVALVTVVILAAPAWAQGSDEKLKSLIGKKQKEQKKKTDALGSAKDEEPATPPPPVAPPPISDADLGLLRALEYAFEPAPREIRVLAVEDLGLLQDPRALNALAHLIFDPDPEVALAAVRTVGHFRAPRAEEILGNVIRHPQLAHPLKTAAVHGLALQGTRGARDLLTELANSTNQPPPVRFAARDVLALISGPAPQKPGAGK